MEKRYSNTSSIASLSKAAYTPMQHVSYVEQLDKLKAEFEDRFKKNYSPCVDKLEDYHLTTLLASGGFGQVYLARHTSTLKYFALKVMEKQNIVDRKLLEQTRFEKKLMSCVRFPFVVSLNCFFVDNVYIYFVMPFVIGGELYSHLRKSHFFSEDLAKFYASQIVLALEYLHHCKIIYRDLKPENIMVEANGYLKLTDFGFAKRLTSGKTHSICGTPEYLAPEIILNTGYSFAVDWWALGILIYEMNCGNPPFIGGDPMKIYEKIVNLKYTFPTKFSVVTKDIVRKFLQLDDSRRLGAAGGTGALEVKRHSWFAGTDWEGTLRGWLPAPFVPVTATPGDTSNFEAKQFNRQPGEALVCMVMTPDGYETSAGPELLVGY